MKKNEDTIIGYRIVSKSRAFVSKWVRNKEEAIEIAKNVKDNLIFGGDIYYLETGLFKKFPITYC